MAGGRPSTRAPSSEVPSSAPLRIPKVNTDLSWSLRCWPVTVTVAGQDFPIAAMPATDWIMAIIGMEDDVLGVLSALLSEEDSEDLLDVMLTGNVDPEDLVNVTMDLVTQVGARPWWVTLRLVGLVRQSWDTIGAELTYRGVDPDRLSFAAWLDVLLLVTMRMMDPKETTMFAMKLEMVPAGYEGQVPEASLEISADAFLSMAG